MAKELGGQTTATAEPHRAVAGSEPNLLLTLGMTLGKVVVFTALMGLAGARVLRSLLTRAERTGSRELFTLTVAAIGLGVAYGSWNSLGCPSPWARLSPAWWSTVRTCRTGQRETSNRSKALLTCSFSWRWECFLIRRFSSCTPSCRGLVPVAVTDRVALVIIRSAGPTSQPDPISTAQPAGTVRI
jgi:hypothetical protein